MAEPKAVRIVVADDHVMLREGLRRSLTTQGYDVVAEANDGREAMELAERLTPDIVLMDVTMPVLDGIEATRRLREKVPAVRVLMLTMHADPAMATSAKEAGAHGYLVKDCTTAEIMAAIDRTLNDEQTFPPSLITAPAPPPPDQPRLITQREAEVLQLIADGKSTVDAARTLYVSVKTVKNHLASIYSKLEAHDRTQAVLRAARLGLISLHDNEP